jgi:protein-L-isoaspartate(D-aspartate) O-methyltransferase
MTLDPERLAAARRGMVDSQLRARGISNPAVLRAMAKVPRHEFVADDLWARAYDDHPLPIGEGQTISQPLIVALMLEAVAPGPSDRVLEVGTGSGYLTALLAELSFHVYSIERHQALAGHAKTVLARLNVSNATIVVSDGSQGLPAQAPFDAIIVSAATAEVPPRLFEQLAEGGRMIIPVGPPEIQELVLVRKLEGKAVVSRREGCRFVPLILDEGTPAAE